MKNDYWNQSMIGLALAYKSKIEISINSLFWFICYLETEMTSSERCYEYAEIIQEAPAITEKDCEDWPTNGIIEFQNYSVRYRPETPLILKDLTFKIKDKEKIGVVGRTGSGKSTLCLTLVRILEAVNGKIIIDGCDISQIGLRKLRSAITMILQDPILFEGTLRYNLDPYGKYSEETLMRAIKKAKLDKILKYENNILEFNAFF